MLRLLCFVVLACAVSVRASTLTVAAAADLRFAFDELTAQYQTNHPTVVVNVTYGSSGNLYAQLQNNAPFDLFFSADTGYPHQLAKAGLALDTNVFVYSVGHIVLWVPRQSSLDLKTLGAHVLLDSSVKKIAIANPQHAPYGRAAVAAMKSLGLFDAAQSKLVYSENISQTAQFVQNGGADIGVLALSLVSVPPLRDSGRYWTFPARSYPKIEQGGIILKATMNERDAREFRDFVLGKRGRAALKRYGFSAP
jgi:molybdate transport system substrate-binding protein